MTKSPARPEPVARPKPLTINGTIISPGHRQTVDLPAAQLFTHTPLTIPVHVIHSSKPGPCLFISASIHGDELNGMEIIYRLLRLAALRQLRGTLLAVPVVNVFGFLNHNRYMPDRRDLNRSFPGMGHGSLASRLAGLFMTHIVAHATHGIDLHTGSHHRHNLPQIRADLTNRQNRQLAQAFGPPVMLHSDLRDGSLRQAVTEKGIPMLLYEAGEALRFDEDAIRVGVRGIINVMRAIGMLPASTGKAATRKPVVARGSTWVRASQSGVLRQAVPLGLHVNRGDLLGVVSEPLGEKSVEIQAPSRGVVIARTLLPLVNEGDALFHVADVDLPAGAPGLEHLSVQPDPDLLRQDSNVTGNL